jgi:hypothetical protein
VSIVTGYRLERSNPPGASGFAWTTIGTVTAGHNPRYGYPAPTPSDSMKGTVGRYFFRVTALTANNEEYWQSNIVSGFSVDNLAPAAVTGGVVALSNNGTVGVRWNRNTTDEDLWGYFVYRDTTSSGLLNSTTPYAQTRDTTVTDSLTLHGKKYYYKVAAVDIHGNIGVPCNEMTQTVTGVQTAIAVRPTQFALSQNYPNPFNPSTTISFSLPSRTFVTLSINDVMGRDVATIASEDLAAGNYSRQWNASGLPSGVYFYRLHAGTYTETKRLLLIK